MLQSLLQWLPSVQPRHGEATWSGVARDRTTWHATAKLSQGRVLAVLESPKLGRAIIDDRSVRWLLPNGTVLERTLPQAFVFPALVSDASSLLDAWKAALGPLAAKSAALYEFDASVTILVIPGLSVFGIATPPLDLGAVKLPRMTGDISLRNIAIDLAGGHVGFVMRVHGVDCEGEFELASNDLLVSVEDPGLWLTLDAVIPFHDGTTRLQIDHAEVRARKHRIALKGPRQLDVAGAAAALSIEGLALTQRKGAAAEVLSGGVRLKARGANGALAPVTFVPIEARRAEFAVQRIELAVIRSANADWSGRLMLDGAQLSLIDPRITGLEGSFDVAFDPANPPQLVAKQFGLALPELAHVDGHLGVRVDLTSANLDLAGLRLVLPSGGALKCDMSVNGGDQRIGIAAKADKAILKGTSDINLFNLAVARYEELPGVAWDVADGVLARRAVNELSLIVELPQSRIIPGEEHGIPLLAGDQIIALLEFAIKEASKGSGFAGEIVKFLKEILRIARNVDDVLGWLGRLGGIFGIGIEGVDLVIRPKDIKISLDPGHTDDRTLGFRVESGLEWIALDVTYSYPDPKWDDWGNRSTDRERIARIDLGLDFPDLVVKVDFIYDAQAKRFRLEGISVHLEHTDNTLISQIEEAAQKIVQAYFGVSTFVGGIVDALNVSMPDGLPPDWDVSTLRIERTDGAVEGLRITLRAFENSFNP